MKRRIGKYRVSVPSVRDSCNCKPQIRRRLGIRRATKSLLKGHRKRFR